METILFTKNDLTSGVEIPADVRKILSFIANWGVDLELALWFDDQEVFIYQPRWGVWTLSEGTMFCSDLIATGIVSDCCTFVFSSVKNVTALCIWRYYII